MSSAPQTTPLGGLAALRLSARAIRGRTRLLGLGLAVEGAALLVRWTFFASALVVLASVALPVVLDAPGPGLNEALADGLDAVLQPVWLLAFGGGWLATEGLLALGRALVGAATLSNLAESLAHPGTQLRGAVDAGIEALPRVAVASFAGALLEGAVGLFRWGALLAGGAGITIGFRNHSPSTAAMAGFALAVAFSVVAGLVTELLVRAWVVRAAREGADGEPIGALAGAAAVVGERLGAFLALMVAVALASMVAGLVIASPGVLMAMVGGEAAGIGVGLRLLASGLSVAWMVLQELWITGALVALDLDVAGELPRPPAPKPPSGPVLEARAFTEVLQAQEVLVAQAVEGA